MAAHLKPADIETDSRIGFPALSTVGTKRQASISSRASILAASAGFSVSNAAAL